ncbi:MAG: CBS domain-containing protein [Candidatus Hodarchaeales archaeon]|jgi:CBS domain-containing protein
MMMEEPREAVIHEVMTRNFFHLKPEEMIDKAANAFGENEIHTLLLVDNKQRIKGVVSAIDVLSRMKEPVKLKKIAVSSPLLHESSKDFIEIAKKMIASDLSLLPVVDKHEKILGIVSLRGLTRLLLETSPIQEADIEDYLEEITAGEVVNQGDSIEKIISIMRQLNTTNLPVIDGSRITGMIRAKELFSEWGSQERVAGGKISSGSGEKRSVEATISSFVMDPVVLTTDGTKLVKDAIDLMYEKNVDFIIFEEEGEPKGKLTMRSLLKEMIEADERSVSASDLVRVDGSPDEEIALICVRKAQSLFEKYETAFGSPRDAMVSFKKILYQSKRGMFSWEVTIKIDFDKRSFHASATDFGSRKTANVAFVRLGRTLRDYRGKLYDKYQRITADTAIQVEEGMSGTFSISVMGSPDQGLSTRIKEQITAYLIDLDMNLFGGRVIRTIVNLEKVETSPDTEDYAWTCVLEIDFPNTSFSKTVKENDPNKAFKQAFDAITGEINSKAS